MSGLAILIPVAIGLIGWFWPTKEETATHCKHEVKPPREEPPPGEPAELRL